MDFKSLGSLLFFTITGSVLINSPEVYDKISEFSETTADLLRMLISADSDLSFEGTFQLKFEEMKIYLFRNQVYCVLQCRI